VVIVCGILVVGATVYKLPYFSNTSGRASCFPDRANPSLLP
jgi:hypothetical protein